MVKEYNEIMLEAVQDTLEEMYQNAYPPISWKQCSQECKQDKSKQEEFRFIFDHHYLPSELCDSILSIAKHNYSYSNFDKEILDFFTDYLLNGGLGADLENPGKDHSKKYPSIKEEISEEAFKVLEQRIKAFTSFYRLDYIRQKFDHNVLMSSPTGNKETVIKYWKSQGVELDIPSDKKIIAHYWGDDEED